ncbi:uncharacterized protein V1518DRAFT_415026 [Limtongia smithiae]|uniref:uncharacterized protein n=1 Tax=Limtongia smithiae TaxID=1125753 RepID=UPI0034CF4A83
MRRHILPLGSALGGLRPLVAKFRGSFVRQNSQSTIIEEEVAREYSSPISLMTLGEHRADPTASPFHKAGTLSQQQQQRFAKSSVRHRYSIIQEIDRLLESNKQKLDRSSNISSFGSTEADFDQILHTCAPADVVRFIQSVVPFTDNTIVDYNAPVVEKDIERIWMLMKRLRHPTVPQTDGLEISNMLNDDTFSYLFSVAWNSKQRSVNTKLVGDVYFIGGMDRPLHPSNLRKYVLSLGECDELDRALSIWQDKGDNCIPPREKLNWMEIGVSLYLQRSDIERAVLLAQEIQQHAGRLSSRVRTMIFVKLCELGKLQAARRVYDEIFNLYIMKKERSGKGGKAEQRQRRKFLSQLLKCARGAFDAGDTKLGFAIMQNFELLGGIVEESSSLLLLDHLTTAEVDKVHTAWKDKSKSMTNVSQFSESANKVIEISSNWVPELQKDEEYFRICLDRFRKLGLVRPAIAVFRKMVENNIKPSSIHIHSLLSVLLNNNNYTSAKTILHILELVREVELSGQSVEDVSLLPPVADHFGLFLQYHARRNQDKEMREILSRMKQLKIAPNTVTLNILMSDAFHDKDIARTLKIFKLIKSLAADGVFPDKHTYMVVWRSLDRHMRATAVTSARRRDVLGMSNWDPENMGLTTRTLRQMLTETASSSVWKHDVNVYKFALRAIGFNSDIVGILCVLEICGRVHKFPLAEEITELVIQNLASILLDHRSRFLPVNELMSPGYATRYISSSGVFGANLGGSDKDSLKRFMYLDILEICNTRDPMGDLMWDDVMKLVYIWLSRATASTEQLQSVLRDLNGMRAKLGLDDEPPSYL